MTKNLKNIKIKYQKATECAKKLGIKVVMTAWRDALHTWLRFEVMNENKTKYKGGAVWNKYIPTNSELLAEIKYRQIIFFVVIIHHVNEWTETARVTKPTEVVFLRAHFPRLWLKDSVYKAVKQQ